MHKIEHTSNVMINRSFPIVLLVAFLIHNAEEALTYGAFREPTQSLVRAITFPHYSAPSVDTFHIALILVSTAAAIAMIWARHNASHPMANALVRGLALIMLINVVVPHVPAALLLGGYTPGLMTAVLVNLPVSVLVLVRSRRTAVK